MTKEEAIAYFGTQSKLGDAVGVDQSTVSQWDRVPDLHQIRIEKITRGRLKADADCWLPPKRRATQ